MTRKVYDVCSRQTYTKNGEEKTKWINHGAVIERDGKLSMKLDSYPVGGEGWFSLFEATPRETPKQPEAKEDDIPW